MYYLVITLVTDTKQISVKYMTYMQWENKSHGIKLLSFDDLNSAHGGEFAGIAFDWLDRGSLQCTRHIIPKLIPDEQPDVKKTKSVILFLFIVNF